MAKIKRKQLSKPLTDQQKSFCREYLKDFNAAAAYRRAGYKSKGTAVFANSSRLIANDKVQEYLGQLAERHISAANIEQDQVVDKLKRTAFADIGDICEFGPNGVIFKNSKDLPANVRAQISEVSSSETKYGTTVRVKLQDQLKALEMLCRYLKLYNTAEDTIANSFASLVHELHQDGTLGGDK